MNKINGFSEKEVKQIIKKEIENQVKNYFDEDNTRTLLYNSIEKLMNESFKAEVDDVVRVKINEVLEREVIITDKWGNQEYNGPFKEVLYKRIEKVLLESKVNSYGTITTGDRSSETLIQYHTRTLTEDMIKRHIQPAFDEIKQKLKSKLEELDLSVTIETIKKYIEKRK